MTTVSQSPDGDFFDPEPALVEPTQNAPAGHSPLTGIFLIRTGGRVCESKEFDLVTVP